jgi:TRAP-type mannitol/chloroaromatic compound transport system substrate-binding protein
LPVFWPQVPHLPCMRRVPSAGVWRLASSFPKSLDTIYRCRRSFRQESQVEMTGGKFVITVHPCGRRTRCLRFGQCWTACQNGTVEMAHTAPYYFFGKDPTYALDCAVPFGLNSRQMTAWMIRRQWPQAHA